MENDTSKNFLCHLLTVVREYPDGIIQGEITKILKTSKQRVNYHIKKAKANGFIEVDKKGNLTFIRITPIGKQALIGGCKRINDTINIHFHISKINMHSYVFSIPIIRYAPDSASFKRYWILKIEGHNTHAYHLKGFVTGVSLKIIGHTLIVYFKGFDIPYSMEFAPPLMSFTVNKLDEVRIELERRFCILIDNRKAKCVNQHIANQIPDLKGNVSLRNQVTLYLGRNAQSVLGEMKTKAYVTIDSTPPPYPNIETNDLVYEEKLLAMPELIYELASDTLVRKESQLYERILPDNKKIMQKLANMSPMREIALITAILIASR